MGIREQRRSTFSLGRLHQEKHGARLTVGSESSVARDNEQGVFTGGGRRYVVRGKVGAHLHICQTKRPDALQAQNGTSDDMRRIVLKTSWRGGCGFVLCIAVLLVYGRATRAVQGDGGRIRKHVVVARTLKLRGPTGKVSAQLESGGPGSGRLSFFGQKDSLFLFTDGGDPRLCFVRRDMGTHLDFYLVDGDAPRALFNHGLETGIDVGVYSDDAPALLLGFEGISGKTIIGAGGLKDHRAEMYVASKGDVVRARCVVDHDKYALISMYDPKAVVRTTIGIGRDSAPVLGFYDGARKRVLSFTEEIGGAPIVTISDPTKQKAWTIQ